MICSATPQWCREFVGITRIGATGSTLDLTQWVKSEARETPVPKDLSSGRETLIAQIDPVLAEAKNAPTTCRGVFTSCDGLQRFHFLRQHHRCRLLLGRGGWRRLEARRRLNFQIDVPVMAGARRNQVPFSVFLIKE